MNKEAVFAIVIGVILGLSGAIYFSNLGKTAKNPSAQLQTFQKTETSSQSGSESAKLAVFNALPENGSLLTQQSLIIKGKAEKNSRLFFANQLQLGAIPVKGGEINQNLNLKPGLNEIVLFETNNDKEQLKVLRVYYFKTQDNNFKPNEEATKEADILKEKLEEKVLELRNNPKQVINGQIKVIGEKNLTLVSGSETIKITLEPEITNFYQVNGYDLVKIEYADLAKNDLVTAFVSDIGGEQISYTVYQEPFLTVAAAKISNIDEDDYKITLIDFDKSSYGADIQVSTIQNLFSLKTGKIEKAGFSKLAIGQRIFAILSGTKENYSVDEYLLLH